MTRTLSLLGGVLALAAVALPGAALAQTAIDPEGRYELIDPPQPTETPGKVEIVDVFSYGCEHCWRFLPSVEALDERKADYVAMRRLPVIFSPPLELLARGYYTAKLLDATEAIHRPLFEAIHLKGQRFDTRESLREFFVAHGIDGEAFDKTIDSFAVETMVRKSSLMQRKYGVRGTPTVIVNGKYRVSASLAGGYDEIAQVAEALAAREHEAMKAAK